MSAPVAYTYASGILCPECAFDRFTRGHIERTSAIGEYDENNMPLTGEDASGGEVAPIYFGDDDRLCDGCGCDDCGCVFRE